MPTYVPTYLHLLKSGELSQRPQLAYDCMTSCLGCGWRCRVNRLEGKTGVCKTGVQARISRYGPHHGEENPLRGWRGSGTIFFSRCNMRCQYCQNHDISQTDLGILMEPEELAKIMLELQDYGCHNINFVSPSHVVPQIIAAVALAAQAGWHIPLVYNTGGYDSLESLQLLDGIIDIYMPDIKYSSAAIARYYSKIPNYPQVNRSAVQEMYRQVGDLCMDEHGIAYRGLLVRHLILPNGLAGTRESMTFLAEEISKNTYLNLMDQYSPDFNAHRLPKLNRRIKPEEFQIGKDLANQAGLCRLDNG